MVVILPYAVYSAADSGPVFLLFFLLSALSCFLCCNLYAMLCCKRCRESGKCRGERALKCSYCPEKLLTCLCIDCVRNAPIALLKDSNITEHKPPKNAQSTKNDQSTVLFFGYKASFKVLLLLKLLVVFLLIYAIAAFFEDFLVQYTTICDTNNPNLACFLFSSKDGPLNCSNASSYDNPNDTIECYEFILDFNSGATAAGGIFTMAGITLTSYGIVLVKLYNSKSFACRRCLIVLIKYLTPIVLSLIAPFQFIFVEFSYTLLLKMFVFELIIFYTVLLPWGQFKQDEADSTTTENEGSPDAPSSGEMGQLLLKERTSTFGSTNTNA